MNQGKSSLIKVNQGKSRWKKWQDRFPWLLKVCVPNHEPKRSLSWNGERCCGWLSPKPRSDLTVPPARLAIGSSFPGDTNCGFMRFLSCLQIFVSPPVKRLNRAGKFRRDIWPPV